MAYYSAYDPKLLESVHHVHCIGCGGSGMYPLIQILHSRGLALSGSDVEETKITAAEREMGMTVSIGHDAANLGDADLVVYSAAIHPATRSWTPPAPRASKRWSAACCSALSAACTRRASAWPVPTAKRPPPA